MNSGLELLAAIEGHSEKLSTKIEDAKNIMTKLYFSESPIEKKYKLFTEFDRKDYKYFMRKETNIIDTENGIDVKAFTGNHKLNHEFIITSYGKNKQKKIKFVTSLESNKHPIFALLFNPERMAYSKHPHATLPYTHEAFSVSQKFLNVIIEEGRKAHFHAHLAEVFSKTHGIDVQTTLPDEDAITHRKAFLYENGKRKHHASKGGLKQHLNVGKTHGEKEGKKGDKQHHATDEKKPHTKGEKGGKNGKKEGDKKEESKEEREKREKEQREKNEKEQREKNEKESREKNEKEQGEKNEKEQPERTEKEKSEKNEKEPRDEAPKAAFL